MQRKKLKIRVLHLKLGTGPRDSGRLENNNFKKVVLFVYDLITLIASYAFTILITFPVAEFTNRFIDNIYFGIINVVVSILLYVAFRLYNSLWRYASYRELTRTVTSSVITSVFQVVFITLFFLSNESSG